MPALPCKGGTSELKHTHAAQTAHHLIPEHRANVLKQKGRDRDNPDGRVSEETFVSALLSSGRVNASPDELAALFAFAASCGEGGGTSDRSRGVTLTHLAVFAADGGPLAVDVAGARHFIPTRQSTAVYTAVLGFLTDCLADDIVARCG